MKKLLVLLLIVASGRPVYGQMENNIWLFAKNIQVVFESGGPISNARSNNILDRIENSAVVCDSSGDLLFYTYGTSVWDRNNDIISNGDDLGGNPSSTQGTVVVQSETNQYLYHIFTLENAGSDDGSNLYHSLLDMQANNEKGFLLKKRELIWSNLTEKMVGVQHPCGGAWILLHERDNDKFLSFHLMHDQIDPNPVISAIGSSHDKNILAWSGELTLSPNDFTLSVLCTDGLFELFTFDLRTGIVSNCITIYDREDTQYPYYSGEFSDDGLFFYLVENNYSPTIQGITKVITQYDLSILDPVTIRDSRVIVGYLDENRNTPTLAMKRGPDRKIYITGSEPYQSLHRIEFPDTKGSLCNFQLENLNTPNKITSKNLPQDLVKAKRREWFVFPDTAICSALEIDLSRIEASLTWNDGATDPIRTISMSGQYTVTAVDSFGCTYSDTFNLEVYDPNLNSIDTILCSGDFIAIHNDTFSQRGSYLKEITIDSSCIDTIHINLDFYAQLFDTLIINLEPGASYQWGDSRFSTPGIFSRKEIDQNGCLTTNYLSINISSGQETGPFIPNAFTLNHDNINDTFQIFTREDEVRKVSEFLIFNRWGQLIFKQQGPIEPHLVSWDGLINGQLAPAGVYVYSLTMTNVNSQKTTYSGSVNLIR